MPTVMDITQLQSTARGNGAEILLSELSMPKRAAHVKTGEKHQPLKVIGICAILWLTYILPASLLRSTSSNPSPNHPYTFGNTNFPLLISAAIFASGTVHCAKLVALSVLSSTLTMFPNTTLPAALRCVKSIGLRLYSVASASPIAFRYATLALLRSM